MTLTTIIATRERPHLIVPTVEATLRNMRRHDSRMLVCLDEDDEASIDAMTGLTASIRDDRLIVSVEPREDSRGAKYDRALKVAPADVYLPIADHCPILTVGYDSEFLARAKLFPDGIGVVFSPFINASFSGMQAMTAKFVEKLGYIYAHDYPFWFIDHEIDDIARMIGRYVMVDVRSEHFAMRPGKTLRLRELNFWVDFYESRTLYRRELARSIIDGADFIAPEWQKEMLRGWFHPIEARSAGISMYVRSAAAQIEALRGSTAPDAGYERIRARAAASMDAMRRAA